MFKKLLRLGWFRPKHSCFLLLTSLCLAVPSTTQATEVRSVVVPAIPLTASEAQPAMLVEPTPFSSAPSDAITSVDPLNSPHPVPWGWIMASHAESNRNSNPITSYYRTPSLISPDGQFAAYSRIKMNAQSELYNSRVSSVMFVENLNTGDLRVVNASSPLADNPLKPKEEASMPGVIAILMPVSWSLSGNRVLARQFEGLFNTSDVSDYAVVWNRQQNQTTTLAPNRVQYTNAVLLGWSKTNPDTVLFRAGILGDENWPLWSVQPTGDTFLANQDEPIIYGRVMNQLWSGPQARW